MPSATSSLEVVYSASDNTIRVKELKNVKTGVAITTATVDVTLYELDKTTTISGQTWPLTLTHVGSPDGTYENTLEDVLVLTNSQRIYAQVVADAGAGLKRTGFTPLIVDDGFTAT